VNPEALSPQAGDRDVPIEKAFPEVDSKAIHDLINNTEEECKESGMAFSTHLSLLKKLEAGEVPGAMLLVLSGLFLQEKLRDMHRPQIADIMQKLDSMLQEEIDRDKI